MRSLGPIVLTSVLGMLLATGNPAHSHAQQSKSVVHPAPASHVITVTLTELHRTKHGKETEVLIAQAAGFPNDTCDAITTFDVVKKYEARQTWSNIRQRVDIVVDGTPYPARFRNVGYYPLGLNLACIDFDSPVLHAQLDIPALPLERDPSDASSLFYDDMEIAKSDPGTPFLNKQGEISSVLIPTEDGRLEFASADDIRAFLKAAADVASWPALISRPPSTI